MVDSITNIEVGTPNPPQGKIAAALAEFQANIPTPVKDSSADTGKYTYDYASLDKLTPLILPALSAVGIAFTAAPDLTALGFGLRAALIHTSGEKIEGFYPLGSPSNPAQAIGSAITYARRYALLALTGVAPGGEDDDGASASASQATVVATATAPAKETPASIRTEMGDTIDNSGGLITSADANKIMTDVTGGKEIKDWTLADMKKARTQLNALLATRAAEKSKS